MGNLSLIVVVLYTFCWVSVSVFEFHTVVVHPGEEVTLQCSNLCSFPAHIFWLKLANGYNTSIISSMFTYELNASLKEGFRNGKFTVTSNRTKLFLRIKQVNFSDSGLYTCGRGTDSTSDIFTVTYLQIEGKTVDVLLFWILCAASIFLLLVISCLVRKIRIIQKAQGARQNVQQNESPDSDNLNYAALSFYPKRKQMTEAEKELETTVVYAAKRLAV